MTQIMTQIITCLKKELEPYLTEEVFAIIYGICIVVLAIIFRKRILGGAKYAINK